MGTVKEIIQLRVNSLESSLQRKRLIIFLIGFTPVLTISVSVSGILPFHTTALFLVLPSLLILYFNIKDDVLLAQRVAAGWVAGLIAVFLYDLSRIPFMLNGWIDFVPLTGSWITTNENMQWLAAYLWRYAGNGGGMGISFYILQYFFSGINLVKAGIIYGLIICSCLFITIIAAPSGESLMFPLTLLNISGSITGHIVFGLSLGILYTVWRKRKAAFF